MQADNMKLPTRSPHGGVFPRVLASPAPGSMGAPGEAAACPR